MACNAFFDTHHRHHEDWFASHGAAYCSELLAIRAMLPVAGFGLEIGVGTGRFAAPLGVRVGVDPSAAMLEKARARGVSAVQGVAGQLPFAAACFDYALSVTTISFVDDVRSMLREARRVIKPDGCLVIGFFDRGSVPGQQYLNQQSENVPYREATFYSAEEMEQLLRDSGFQCQEWVQTIAGALPDIVEIEPFRPGRGKDAFVVVKAMGVLPATGAGVAKHNDLFQRLVDFSADWMYWRTPGGVIRYISPAGSIITGYSIEELSLLPETFAAIIHPDDQGSWSDHVHEADKQGKPRSIDFRIVTKQGDIRWISHICGPIYDDDGFFLGTSGSNRDITARKQVENEIARLSGQLAARASELEAANQEMETFSYSLTHDLRKPLTIISGYCQVIQETCGDTLDEHCKNDLAEILNGTQRMNQLIDALLKFSVLARSELRLERVDLSEMTKKVAAELRLTEAGREVAFKIAEEVTANGDRNLLQVVIDNLLGNAWKYTSKEQQAVIVFGVQEIEGATAYYVQDNGAGFSMADAGKLFTPLQRLPGAENFEGFGIGLATVERIIHRHGGRIWAEGEPGKGATFYFTLTNGRE